MKKTITFVALLLALQTACTQANSHVDASADVDTISVSGLGEVEVKSDQANLYLELSAENKEMSTAKAQADARYQGLLDILSKQGIAKENLSLNQLNMNPMYEWRTESNQNRRYQTGFRVSRNLSLELNNLELLPALLEALANANSINVNSISRGLQDPSAVIAEATKKAAQDAKLRAAFIAEQFDRELGEIKSVQAHHSSVPFAQESQGKVAGMARMADSAPQEQLGTQTVSASLSVVFKLK